LAGGAAEQIRLDQLPGYVLDRNLAEGVWHYLKQVELRTVTCHDLAELRYALCRAVARLRHQPDVVRSSS
jgi:hypothetical protein